jgi:hypothetical protein
MENDDLGYNNRVTFYLYSIYLKLSGKFEVGEKVEEVHHHHVQMQMTIQNMQKEVPSYCKCC